MKPGSPKRTYGGPLAWFKLERGQDTLEPALKDTAKPKSSVRNKKKSA